MDSEAMVNRDLPESERSAVPQLIWLAPPRESRLSQGFLFYVQNMLGLSIQFVQFISRISHLPGTYL